MSRPAASSAEALRRMQRQRRRDTGPEMAIRRLLHAAGYRYRVDRQVILGLRRRADLVFSSAKVAVFVDGCFWHSCPVHGTTPARNRAWWQEKLARNVMRDRDTDERLSAAGWCVVRVWEHESADEAAKTVAATVSARRPGPPRGVS